MLSYLGGQLRRERTRDHLVIGRRGGKHGEEVFQGVSLAGAPTHQQLNLGDGNRAQSGEKSVPDDFLLLYPLSLACSLARRRPPHLSEHPNARQCSPPPPHPSSPHNSSAPSISLPRSLPGTQRPRQSLSSWSYLRRLSLSSSPPLIPPSSPSRRPYLPAAPPHPASAFQHDKPHGISLVL